LSAIEPTSPLDVLLSICAAYGVKTSLQAHPEGRDTRWHGPTQTMYAGGTSHRGVVEDICHELGHWLICPSDCRVYTGFGLGRSFDYIEGLGWDDGPRVLSGYEHKASAVGIVIHACLDVGAAYSHFKHHDWCEFQGVFEITKIVMELISSGVFDITRVEGITHKSWHAELQKINS
jgi:hypothetical protein